MARPLIAGNWKMNLTIEEARSLVAQIRPDLQDIDGVDVVLCPPFTALAPVKELLSGSTIALGAQNMHHEESGAFTGEVSPAMVRELCRFVILGHSERRQHLGETDDLVGKKLSAALRLGLTPVLCVGERLEDREDGRAEDVVERQVRLGLARMDSTKGLVVAYEPVWAIGTGRAATPDDARQMIGHIRRTLADLFGDAFAADSRLLYGGSVTADNVADFMSQDGADGALVGGASLKAASFVALVRGAASAS